MPDAFHDQVEQAVDPAPVRGAELLVGPGDAGREREQLDRVDVRPGLPGSPGLGQQGGLRRLGFTDADLAGDRSDRLIDATLAWDEPEAVVARLRAHLDAGADQVLVQPYGPDLPSIVDQLERLA